MNRRWLALAAVATVLTACAAGPNVAAAAPLAGFWQGLWHGLIYPVTFIISLFTDNVNIYEVRNNGNWYDFGFVVGIGLLHTIFSTGKNTPKRRKAARSSAGGPVA